MNDSFVPPGYVPRGEGLAEVTRAVAAARGLERERRIRRLVTIGGGWAVAVFMTVVAAACLGVMWVRPVPRDLLYVAMMHDDGTYDAAPAPRGPVAEPARHAVPAHGHSVRVRPRELFVGGRERELPAGVGDERAGRAGPLSGGHAGQAEPRESRR